MINLGKVITAMITPFNSDEEINFKMVKKLAKKLADEGSDGILVTGTTGESPTLSHEEDLLLYATVLEEVGDRVKVIAGTGSNSTATSIKYTKMAESIGVHAAMIVVPYYNKPSQEGMYQHFSAIAENTDLPLMIYNIPGRTGINMLPATVARIVDSNRNFISIKEASGNLEQMQEIISLVKKKGFTLYSGDDGLTLDVVKMGGAGVVSVASHIVGSQIAQMIDLFHDGMVDEAESINQKLMDLFKVLFITANPSPVKAALGMVGFPVGKPRLPLIAVNENERKDIQDVLKKLRLV